jgi:hypothetical protein
MKTISQAFATLLQQSNGKFVTLSFIKKDGTQRTMNCRMGVTKALKGGVCTVNLDQYVVVYDMAKKAYRSINKDTIVSVSIAGERAGVYA